MWQQAHTQDIPSLDPCHDGWSVENGGLVPLWSKSDRVPKDPSYEEKWLNEDYEDEIDDLQRYYFCQHVLKNIITYVS